MIVTKEYLDSNPNTIFVFGDNTMRMGMGGAARLRYHPQSFGFITKKQPDHKDTSYYTPEEYKPVYQVELERLVLFINANLSKTILISAIGAGLANKYNIFEKVIEPSIKEVLKPYKNVQFLW